MSKEVYLKGEQKLKAITFIKTGLGVRMKPKEILERLKNNGIDIGERTYRRLKLEIYQSAGNTLTEISKNQAGGTFFHELLSYEEMERRCWELYYEVKTPNEKFRALSQLRMISQDKMKAINKYALGTRMQKLDHSQLHDDLKELDEEGVPSTP